MSLEIFFYALKGNGENEVSSAIIHPRENYGESRNRFWCLKLSALNVSFHQDIDRSFGRNFFENDCGHAQTKTICYRTNLKRLLTFRILQKGSKAERRDKGFS